MLACTNEPSSAPTSPTAAEAQDSVGLAHEGDNGEDTSSRQRESRPKLPRGLSDRSLSVPSIASPADADSQASSNKLSSKRRSDAELRARDIASKITVEMTEREPELVDMAMVYTEPRQVVNAVDQALEKALRGEPRRHSLKPIKHPQGITLELPVKDVEEVSRSSWMQQVFGAIDTNGDGVIDQKEFEAAAAANKVETMEASPKDSTTLLKGKTEPSKQFKAKPKDDQGVSLQAWLSTEPEKDTLEWYQWRVASMVESGPVQFMLIALIIVNGIMIGVSTDYPDIISWNEVETAFTWIFALEIMVKLFGLGRMFWWDAWNIFDFLVVLCSLVEFGYDVFSSDRSSMSGLTVLRLVRIFRMLRVVGRLERLNVLVQAFLYALQSVAWVGVLMVIILYIFGVLATKFFGQNSTLQNASRDASTGVDIYDWFGNVPRSMASLLQIITMDSWSSQISRPMGNHMPWAWAFTVFFLIAVGLGFLNLLSAIFVDSLLEMNKVGANEKKRAQKIKEEDAMSHLTQLFSAIDIGGTGSISEDELNALLETLHEDKWEKVLKALEVSPDGLEVGLRHFQVRSESQNELYYDDFLDMFNKLSEPASKQDVWKVDKAVAEHELQFLELKRKQHQMGNNLQGLQQRVEEMHSLLERIVTKLGA